MKFSHFELNVYTNGRTDLEVSKWIFLVCSAHHDRNQNAAQNILVKGLLALRKKQTIIGEARACEAVMNKDSGAKVHSCKADHKSTMAEPGKRPLIAGILVRARGSFKACRAQQ